MDYMLRGFIGLKYAEVKFITCDKFARTQGICSDIQTSKIGGVVGDDSAKVRQDFAYLIHLTNFS